MFLIKIFSQGKHSNLHENWQTNRGKPEKIPNKVQNPIGYLDSDEILSNKKLLRAFCPAGRNEPQLQ